MEKASIITSHCSDNFGAFLQAYTLQNVIKNLGVDMKIINFRPDGIIMAYKTKIDFVGLVGVKGLLKTISRLLSVTIQRKK